VWDGCPLVPSLMMLAMESFGIPPNVSCAPWSLLLAANCW
jgi:hypothetical protein